MTVLLGGLSAVFFGIGDLLGGIGVRKSGRSGAAVGMSIVATSVGALVIGVYLLFSPPESLARSDIGWSVLAGLSMSATRPLLYLGMARGPIAVFAPTFGLTAITVPALVGPLVGQHPGMWELLGLVAAFPAVVLLSGEGRVPTIGEIFRSPVLGMAVLVGTCIGIAGLFLSFVDDSAGVFPAFMTLAVGFVVLPVVSVLMPGRGVPDRVTTRFGAILGVTSAIAFMLSTLAYQRGSAAVVTALICLCPGVSIVIAWKFLHERLAALQMVGGAFGVLTVVLFALGN